MSGKGKFEGKGTKALAGMFAFLMIVSVFGAVSWAPTVEAAGHFIDDATGDTETTQGALSDSDIVFVDVTHDSTNMVVTIGVAGFTVPSPVPPFGMIEQEPILYLIYIDGHNFEVDYYLGMPSIYDNTAGGSSTGTVEYNTADNTIIVSIPLTEISGEWADGSAEIYVETAIGNCETGIQFAPEDRAPDEGTATYPPGSTGESQPTCEITNPTGGTVSGQVTITGNASVSAGTVSKVEVKIDNGDWAQATNTGTAFSTWSYNWNSANVFDGTHIVYARAYVGAAISPLAKAVFTTSNSNPPSARTPEVTDNTGDAQAFLKGVPYPAPEADILAAWFGDPETDTDTVMEIKVSSLASITSKTTWQVEFSLPDGFGGVHEHAPSAQFTFDNYYVSAVYDPIPSATWTYNWGWSETGASSGSSHQIAAIIGCHDDTNGIVSFVLPKSEIDKEVGVEGGVAKPDNKLTNTFATTWITLGVGATLSLQTDRGPEGTAYGTDYAFTGGVPPVPPTQDFIISLKSGWNLISFPVVPTPGYTAQSLLEQLGSVNFEQVQKRNSDGTYSIFKKTSSGWSGTDFAIEPDYGYFVSVKSDKSTIITGALGGVRNVPLKTGWNLIGWTSLDNTKTAQWILEQLGSVNFEQVQKRNSDGTYSIFKKTSSGWSGTDFAIQPGNGYFVSVKSGKTLTYGG